MRAIGRALRGLGAAVWSRPWPFCAIALGVFALDIVVPPLVLTLARKPVTAFTINPVLSTLPGYLVSGPGSLGERLAKAWGLALFWFSADNSFGLEWGFAVTTADLARFAFMSLLVGLYFSLWMERRARFAGVPWGRRAGGTGGVLGALGGVFGLSTGGCTVMGCGAPVLPVIGLAFVGLSSTTIKWMSELSVVATAAVLIGLATAVLWLGWRVGAREAARPG
ncbi:MAG TPA: hypothetical protein VNP91_14060 [Methylomirabilota bacterium]|jgi:hypothetical protein|nr:hypothetical protein [Methylomirabilota bacterium]